MSVNSDNPAATNNPFVAWFKVELKALGHGGQLQLAKELKVSEDTIGLWKRGQRTPRKSILPQLATRFKLPLAELEEMMKEVDIKKNVTPTHMEFILLHQRPMRDVSLLPDTVLARQKELERLLEQITKSQEPVRLITLYGKSGIGRKTFAERLVSKIIGVSPQFGPYPLPTVDLSSLPDEANENDLVRFINRRIGIFARNRKDPIKAITGLAKEKPIIICLAHIREALIPAVKKLLLSIYQDFDKPVAERKQSGEEANLIIVIASDERLKLEQEIASLLEGLTVDEAEQMLFDEWDAEPWIDGYSNEDWSKKTSEEHRESLRQLLSKVLKKPRHLGLIRGLTRRFPPYILLEKSKNVKLDTDENMLRFFLECLREIDFSRSNSLSQTLTLDRELSQIEKISDHDFLLSLSVFSHTFSAESAYSVCLASEDIERSKLLWRRRDIQLAVHQKLSRLITLGWINPIRNSGISLLSSAGIRNLRSFEERYSISSMMKSLLASEFAELNKKREANSPSLRDRYDEFFTLLSQESKSCDGWDRTWLNRLYDEAEEFYQILKDSGSRLKEWILVKTESDFVETRRESRSVDDAPKYVDYCLCLQPLWEQLGWFLSAHDLLNIAVQAQDKLLTYHLGSTEKQDESSYNLLENRKKYIRLLTSLGMMQVRLDENKLAGEIFDSALTKMEEWNLDFPDGKGFALLGRSVIKFEDGQYQSAIDDNKDARGIFNKTENSYYEWLTIRWEGRFHYSESKFNEAISCFKLCLHLAEERQDTRNMTTPLLALTRTAHLKALAKLSPAPLKLDASPQEGMRGLLNKLEALVPVTDDKLQQAHYYCLLGLFQCIEKSPFGEAQMNIGFDLFKETGDRYWGAYYTTFAAYQYACLEDRASVGTNLSKAIVAWNSLCIDWDKNRLGSNKDDETRSLTPRRTCLSLICQTRNFAGKESLKSELNDIVEVWIKNYNGEKEDLFKPFFAEEPSNKNLS